MTGVASSSQSAAAFLSGSIDARLIAVLDFYTRRDLLANPPQDSETLQRIGIAATNADRFIRPWVNDAFREPNKWPKLVRGGLPISTTYGKLRDYCTKQ